MSRLTFKNPTQELVLTKTLRSLLTLIMLMLSSVSTSALTDDQQKGLFRHGIWEWSIRTCPGILRNKGYWFALKEVGGFKNADHIIQNELDESFKRGWRYMAENSTKFGLDKTCDYAIDQWPAVLWRETNE